MAAEAFVFLFFALDASDELLHLNPAFKKHSGKIIHRVEPIHGRRCRNSIERKRWIHYECHCST